MWEKAGLPSEQKLCLSDAFYAKNSSKLELVVTVKNCSDSRNLPVAQKCDIPKEYCQFIEIVERNYDKRHPQRSFRRAMNEPRRKRSRYRSFAGFTLRTYPFIATQASGYVTRP